MEKIVYISKSPASTQRFAKNLAGKIKAGDILALYGSLGAGKTTFVQGLASGLGYTGRVFSPTFIFVRPYQIADNREQKAPARQSTSGEAGGESRQQRNKIKTLYHIDLYRIEKPTDAQTIGIEDFLTDETAVSAIEWPEKIENKLPKGTIKIKFEVAGESERRIKVDD